MNLKAIKQGKDNFDNQTEEINNKAKERYSKCKCAFKPAYIIQKMLPKDEAIPEISGMICEECSCVLSWKLRQDIEKCEKWQE